MNTLDYTDVKYFELAVGDNIGKKTETDIACRCVICGDSHNNPNKKRLHLYIKDTYESSAIKCFNCEYTSNMYGFLKEVRPDLYTNYVKEKKGESFQRLKDEKEGNSVLDKNFMRPKKGIPPTVFKMPKEFIKIIDADIKFINYIDTRGINYDDLYCVDQLVMIREKEIALMNMLVIPLWFDKSQNEIYGFQCRSIVEKFFYTYIPDDNQGFKVWNWFGINKSLPTYIFESYFDARSSGLPINQICSALGADLNNERINELKEPIFCFDNQLIDPTANVKSKKLLQEGKKVFIWPEPAHKFKDFNAILTAGGSFEKISNMIKNNIKEGIMGSILLKLKR